MILNASWTAYVVGEMHRFRISGAELAKECGYTPAYLSTVLNGNKDFKLPNSADLVKKKILTCLEDMKAERMKEVEGDADDED